MEVAVTLDATLAVVLVQIKQDASHFFALAVPLQPHLAPPILVAILADKHEVESFQISVTCLAAVISHAANKSDLLEDSTKTAVTFLVHAALPNSVVALVSLAAASKQHPHADKRLHQVKNQAAAATDRQSEPKNKSNLKTKSLLKNKS